ncbi:MAG: hypothetical protein ABFD91_02635 [Anaerohalosphaeraceae bacterium]
MTKENNIQCQQASACYFDYLSHNRSDIPDDMAVHISNCPDCQSEIKKLDCCIHDPLDVQSLATKVQYLALHHRLLNEWVSCDDIKPFLVLMNQASGDAPWRTAVTAHLESCPQCQSRFQTIRKMNMSFEQAQCAISFLADQPDSDMLSQALLKDLVKIKNSENSGIYTRAELTADGRLEIGVKQLQAVKGSTRSKPAGAVSRRLWIRAGLAASILMGISICFLSVPSAEGIALKQVYRAVEQIKNCRIQIFVPEQTKPVQTILISRELQIQMYQNSGNATLWDLNKQTMLNSNSISQEPVRQASLPPLQASQKGFGLMPFNSIRDLPATYSWVQVEGAAQAGDNQQVYDLQWGQSDNPKGQIARRWRGFLNASTMLPDRIEWWEQLPNQKEQLMMQMVIDYPDSATTEGEIQKLFPRYKTSE